MPDQEQTQNQLEQVFFPYAARRLKIVKENNTRFVHYTSATVAIDIIEKQQVWLRNAALMNDFSEVQHGQNCLVTAWHDEELGRKIKAILENISKGFSNRFAENWNASEFERVNRTYMMSISEHGDAQAIEEKYGRLSMWRAYGGTTNVALVMNNRPFVEPSDALNAFTSPVLYKDAKGFKAEFQQLLASLENNSEILYNLGEDEVSKRLFSAFHFAALSTKHPGFAEEREWRVVYSPTLLPSKKIKPEIKAVNGIPQHIHIIDLEDSPEENLIGLTLPDLLHEIIIGPTEYPFAIYEALVQKLIEKGVENAVNKVRLSNIPLRR